MLYTTVFRIYPGGRIEMRRKIPTKTVVVKDSEIAIERLARGEMIHADPSICYSVIEWLDKKR